VQLARVIGTVVATVKTPGLEGVKLLVIQPLDRRLTPVGNQVVAADAVHMAGPGELVYFVAAREAAEAMPNRFVPVDHAIVGIVDAVQPLAGVEPPAGAEPPPASTAPPPASPPPPEPKARPATGAPSARRARPKGRP
jgi:ethanolamine utilization protein EutN